MRPCRSRRRRFYVEKMTVERLDQYLSLKKEIRDLEEQYRNLCASKDKMVSDSVSGSMAEYPYIRQVVKIQGLDVVDQERRARMAARAKERKEACEREVEAIDLWVGSLQDSRIRRIIMLKYILGKSWVQVAHQVGGDNTADGVRMAFSRFMQKS